MNASSSHATGRYLAVALAAVAALVLGLLSPLVSASAADSGQSGAAAGQAAAVTPNANPNATNYVPMVMMSSHGDEVTTSVSKATKKKAKKVKRKIYKKTYKKTYKSKIKKHKKKHNGKCNKKCRKDARKAAKKKARKAGKKAYKHWIKTHASFTVKNVDWVLRSDSDKTLGVRRAELGDGSVFTSLGEKPIGRIAGETKDGKRIDVPVYFDNFTTNGNTVKMTAAAVDGEPSADVRSRSDLLGYGAQQRSTTWRKVTVLAQPSDTKTWRWSEIRRGGTVTRNGNSFTATINTASDGEGAGVQPGGASAAMKWADVAKNWKVMSSNGVKPRLAIWASEKGKSSGGAILAADGVDFNKSTGKLTVKGTLNAQGGDVKSVLPEGNVNSLDITLETANMGRLTRYVVVTGDSIASGEGGRWAGNYNAPSFYGNNADGGEGNDNAKALLNLCNDNDIACTGKAGSFTLTKPGSLDRQHDYVTYGVDRSKAYEDTSFDNEAQGQACHRSKVSPGTWLARYLKTQKGQDVDYINLACSGAQSKDVLKTSFKGEEPQVERLTNIAQWLPVEYVTNTIGANDIKFSEVATACFLAPLTNTGLLEQFSGGNFDFNKIVAGSFKLMPAGTKHNGQWVWSNPDFKTNYLCSERGTVPGKNKGDDPTGPTLRQVVADRIKSVPGAVSDVLTALHKAAPDAPIVSTNYPNLLPPSAEGSGNLGRLAFNANFAVAQSKAPLVSGIPQWQFIPDCVALGSADKLFEEWSKDPKLVPIDPNAFQVQGQTLPAPVGGNVAQQCVSFFSSPVPKSNPGLDQTWNALDNTVQVGVAGLTTPSTLLRNGQIMYGPDQDWASMEVVPALNRAVLDGVANADPNGEWSIAVDQSQLFNGRQMNTQFAYTDPSKIGQEIQDEPVDPATRSTFTNVPLIGQSLPVVCPGVVDQKTKTDWAAKNWGILDGYPGVTKGSYCPGDKQEALHPNWYGQAASGQCIVAVVTGGKSKGCVRSIGDGSAKNTSFVNLLQQWTAAPGQDQLCLVDPKAALAASEQGQSLPCASGTNPMPTWDTKRYKMLKAQWQ